MSIQRPSCFFNLCSSSSSRSNKRRRDSLLPPPRGRLCCRAGLTAPPYSHRWPSHPSTDPHLLLFSGDGRRTSKPSYIHTPLCVGKQLPSLPWLRVVPFLGLVVVHRPGALGVAWSTWSMTDMHLEWTVRGEADSWVHDSRKEVPPYYAKNNYSSIPPPDIWDPSKRASVFREKTLPPLTARTHQLYLRTQGSASLLRTKKMNTPPVSWDPV